MSFWGFLGAGALGAAASIFGSNRAADAVEDAGDAAARVQNRALDLQVALSRPQLEVGTSALTVLADIFGLERPTPINFGGLGGRGVAGAPFSPGGTLNDAQQAALGSFIESFGFSPIAEPEKSTRVGPSDFASNRHRDDWLAFQAAFGYNPFERAGNPFLDPALQAEAGGGAPSAGVDLESLVANNPLIQFQREEGERAIARGAAARGLNESGGTLRDLAEFNQGLSSTGIQNFVLNPLFQLAGFGPQASAQASSAVGNNASNLSTIALNTGNARASAFQNQGNTIGNLIAGLPSYFNQPPYGVPYRGNNPRGFIQGGDINSSGMWVDLGGR